jgi:cell division protein FtsB
MESNDMPPDRRATLGCGTLILIALIVIFFSGRGVSELLDEVQQMRREVQSLDTAIGTQSEEITMLRAEIEALREELKK